MHAASPASFVTRFAPSPTGFLHLGHAYSALTAFAAATTAHGRFLLRIEDIDRTRCRPAFEAAIYEDLSWLGVRWETPVRRQSEHLADYEAALDRLGAAGLLYRDFRTRRQQAESALSAPHGPVPVVVAEQPTVEDEARFLAEGRPFAWRLSLAGARRRLGPAWDTLTIVEEIDGAIRRCRAEPERQGDVVLARKDVGVAYHLAAVLDDGLQGITHVIRGEDLTEACHIQRLLQALLDLPTPVYRHHPLLLDQQGRRLAKRDGAPSLRELRAAGVTAAEVREQLGLPLPR